ncbi:MAG: hypothetical protein K0R34_1224 [Herbinix sp.]|jgi:hypothetical protein|nr:hypothetical protein [Herbinix sp.]
MNLKVRLYILGFYDLLLAIGTVYLWRELVCIEHGIFTEFPHEGLSFLAVEDWIVSGITALLIFGVGNMIASIFCFVKQNHLSWSLSAAMGSILYVILVIQVLLTGIWQMSTGVFFALSILQLFFSRIVYLGYKKKAHRYSGVRSYINS